MLREHESTRNVAQCEEIWTGTVRYLLLPSLVSSDGNLLRGRQAEKV